MTAAALADTSVWGKRHLLGSAVRDWFDRAVVAQAIATCDVVKSELLYSTRNVEEFRAQRGRLGRLPFCPIGPPQWERAFDVFDAIAGQTGQAMRAIAPLGSPEPPPDGRQVAGRGGRRPRQAYEDRFA